MNILSTITPEMEKMAENTGFILAIITAIAFIIGLILFLVYAFMKEIKKTEEQDNWIKTLDEHDKSVIAHYKAINPNPWKRRTKK